MDIAYDPSPSAAALETEADICSEEAAVTHLDILHSAGHFATHHKAAMAMENNAVADYQVLARPCPAPSVLILSGFDADGIVTYIEGGIVSTMGCGR